MTRIVARLLGSMICAPIVMVACVAFALALAEIGLFDEDEAVTLAMSCAPALFTLSWLVVWAKVIRWTRARRLGTAITLIVSVAMQISVGGLGFAMLPRFPREPVIILSNLMIGLVAWAICVWLWTETAKERYARVRRVTGPSRTCPACRYDMSGLSNLTCPECGTAYTLGQLIEEHQRAEAPADFEASSPS